LSNAIVQALEDAAQKVAKAIEDAARSVGHFFEDTGTRVKQAVTDLTEHDGKAASELEKAGKHADETPHVHGAEGSITRPASAGPVGPNAGAEVDQAAAYGSKVRQGLADKLADPRTKGQFPDVYDPFHGGTEQGYIDRHSTGVDENGNPLWNYKGEAPNNGALNGREDRVPAQVGQRVDRYGHPGGYFLSPEGTPYPQRGLPNDNLAKPYHRYEVVRPFDWNKALVKPAFEEPGLGVQFRLDDNFPVDYYLKNGYLRDLDAEGGQ
jgi:hypothetical protein